jgi:hypothetical protein
MPRKLLSIGLSVLAGVAFWAMSEGLALASPAPSLTVQPTNLACAPQKQAAARAGHILPLTVAEAHACWPNAHVSTDGWMRTPGEYIIPHGTGWIHAGFSVSNPIIDSKPLGARDALAYSCGQGIWRNISSWEQYLTYIALYTTNSASYCYSAWNTSLTPTCSGGGTCQPPQTGVIGNHSANENPWYNQVVYYGPFTTDTFYCRHYYSAYDRWSAWCS